MVQALKNGYNSALLKRLHDLRAVIQDGTERTKLSLKVADNGIFTPFHVVEVGIKGLGWDMECHAWRIYDACEAGGVAASWGISCKVFGRLTEERLWQNENQISFCHSYERLSDGYCISTLKTLR